MQTAKQIADAHLEQSRNIASINLLHAQEELGRRLAADKSTMTLKNLLDFAEHSYKVSGLQGRQEPKVVAPAVSIRIHLGDTAQDTITIEHQQPDQVESLAHEAGNLELAEPTPAPPHTLRSASGNLLALLDGGDDA